MTLLTPTFDQRHPKALATPLKGPSGVAGWHGVIADGFARWRRAETERAALSQVDPKDLGYPSHLADGTALAAPNRFTLIALAVFGLVPIGLAGAAVAQAMPAAALESAATLGAVLIGSIVSGAAGFAFSAIAGSLLLHVLPPESAVPLLLACSIATQLVSIAALRRTVELRGSLPLLAGGFLGIPAGAYLLQSLDCARFDIVFGAFLVAYAGYTLARPNFAIRKDGGGPIAAVAVGFFGGLTGGAAAFPGAAPTIWCSLRALPKDKQRGTVQPFILIMQIATLGYFSRLGMFGAATEMSFLWCAPVVLLGTCVGIRLFRGMDDAMFRRVLLGMLMVSGAVLIW